MKTHRSLRSLIFALTLTGVVGVASSAAFAAPSPTPSGLTGAANMTNPNALAGMVNAMTVGNVNGCLGMYGAVYHTTSWDGSANC